jgi:hypothetical protein
VDLGDESGGVRGAGLDERRVGGVDWGERSGTDESSGETSGQQGVHSGNAMRGVPELVEQGPGHKNMANVSC